MYIRKMSSIISDQFHHNLYRTKERLEDSSFKNDCKITAEHQKIITEFGENLESLVKDYLVYHISIVRLFKYNDNELLNIIRTVNVYKRKGAIAALKINFKNFGSNNIRLSKKIIFDGPNLNNITPNLDELKESLTRFTYSNYDIGTINWENSPQISTQPINPKENTFAKKSK